MALALLVGGPLSGQYRDMPDDVMTTRVERDSARPVSYTRMRVSTASKETEVWGWSPMCYRQIKDVYLRLEEV